MANAPNKITTWLFNPFTYVAGVKALCIGLGIIVVSALHAALVGVQYNGLLRMGPGETTFLMELAKLLILPALLIAPLWVAGKFLSNSNFRLIDLIGTQWLARWPLQFLSIGMFHIPGYQQLLYKLASTPPPLVATNIEGKDLAILLVVGVFSLAALVWTLVLMYRSFAVSCNVKGGKAIATFVVITVIATLASGAVLPLIYRIGMAD